MVIVTLEPTQVMVVMVLEKRPHLSIQMVTEFTISSISVKIRLKALQWIIQAVQKPQILMAMGFLMKTKSRVALNHPQPIITRTQPMTTARVMPMVMVLNTAKMPVREH